MTAQPKFSLIVGYGTDMGNAEDAAMSFAEAVQEAMGIESEAVELNQVEIADLQSASHFIVVTSTFGDGEFPDSAALFWEAISAESADQLDHLKFAVLALGDSSYELFCNAGRLLDERLQALGAVRLTARVDVDGAYQQLATAWTGDLVKLLAADRAHAGPRVATVAKEATAAPPPPSRDHHQRFEAPIVVNRLLSAPGSEKEVRHYELDLTGAGIAYSAGDSIAVHVANDPDLVDAVLAELDAGPDHAVAGYDEPLGVLLTHHLDIRAPSRALRALVASRAGDADAVAALAGDGTAKPGTWLYGRDVLDLIRLGELSVDELVDNLRPLQFRDYSIASSPVVHPDRAHLTVATVRYTAQWAPVWRGGLDLPWPTAARRHACTCDRITPSACPALTSRSSWSVRGPALRRSAAFCRNGRRPGRRVGRGCSSARGIGRWTSSTPTNCTASGNRACSRDSTWRSPATTRMPRNSMCSTACGRTPRKSSAGSKRVRTCTCVATPSEWPRTSTRRCERWWPTPAR
ncbi:flavodoxin domain-containing protein [Mycobacterium intracellulare]|uniref:flavodoxin domain-containing protein n=1 Tax=Mycobacterium intracellulare TaxID=1767 RepID=UPI00398B3122